ncbi:MAG: hypothetical protein ACXVZX_08405 [Terriglobales bacterium]
MKLRWMVLFVILVAAVTVGTYELKATPQINVGEPCRVVVPAEWGEFKGVYKYGFLYEDKEGTLRIVDRMPCTDTAIHENAPRVSVEIRRK